MTIVHSQSGLTAPAGDSGSTPTILGDSHLHLFRRGYHRQFTGDADDDLDRYEQIRRRHVIGAGLVVGYEADGVDPGNNRYLRALAAAREWMTTVAFVVHWPAPGIELLEGLFEAGHRGIALYCRDADAAGAVASWPAECWRLLDRRQALVSVNGRPEAHSRLIELARSAPACQFLFSHLGLPGAYREPPDIGQVTRRLGALISAAAAGNCWVKISGLYAIGDQPEDHRQRVAEPFVTTILDAYGPAKCLWGSDFSPSLDHQTFEETMSVPGLTMLSGTERRQVMGQNLVRLLESGAGT